MIRAVHNLNHTRARLVTYTGETITAENCVAAPLALTLRGKNTRTGNPTPTKPVHFTYANGVTVDVAGERVTSDAVLRSVGGTYDSLDVTGGVLTQRVEEHICRAEDGWTQYPTSVGATYPCFTAPALTGRTASSATACTHLTLVASLPNLRGGTRIGFYANSAAGLRHEVYLTLPYTVLGTTAESTAEENVAAFCAWLAGADMRIYYVLGTPIVTQHTPITLRSAAPATVITNTAGLTMTAQIRTLGT